MAKNITLSLDETVLTRVRAYAAANNTSVNALVRSALEQIAAKGQRADAAWDALFAEIDKDGAEVGRKSWTRGDLYDR